MKKAKMLALTAGLCLAITFILSCEDKEKDKPATVADTASTAVTATLDTPHAFTDSRDGKTYKKVTIGSQTWMAENLNYEAKGSKCYDNKPDNCVKYGRLYDWNTALKVCPSGWHLPNRDEWQKIVDFTGGKETAGNKLKAKEGWAKKGNGTNEYGFSALPGGYGNSSGNFNEVVYSGLWWSANEDENDSDGAYSQSMGYGLKIAFWINFNKSFLFSVRCLQD